METNSNKVIVKVGIIAAISLILLILLSMVKKAVQERSATKENITMEVAEAYGKKQTVRGPVLLSEMMVKPATSSTESQTSTLTFVPTELTYKSNAKTEVRRRVIYEVIVYNSRIVMTGKIRVMEETLKVVSNAIMI